MQQQERLAAPLVVEPDSRFTDANDRHRSGPADVFGPEGTAIVIHADADDEKTDPAGNSDARIACGVIEKK